MKNIDKAVIIRTIVLIIALINQLIVCLGYNPLPFDDCRITEIVSTCVTIVVALWNWWGSNFNGKRVKNNDNEKE